MAVNATVNTPRTTTANLSQANTSQVVRVTVPGPKGDTGISTASLADLTDVNASSLANGAVLQYEASSSTWITKNTLGQDAPSATILTINCGNY